MSYPFDDGDASYMNSSFFQNLYDEDILSSTVCPNYETQRAEIPAEDLLSYFLDTDYETEYESGSEDESVSLSGSADYGEDEESEMTTGYESLKRPSADEIPSPYVEEPQGVDMTVPQTCYAPPAAVMAAHVSYPQISESSESEEEEEAEVEEKVEEIPVVEEPQRFRPPPQPQPPMQSQQAKPFPPRKLRSSVKSLVRKFENPKQMSRSPPETPIRQCKRTAFKDAIEPVESVVQEMESLKISNEREKRAIRQYLEDRRKIKYLYDGENLIRIRPNQNTEQEAVTGKSLWLRRMLQEAKKSRERRHQQLKMAAPGNFQ